MVFRQAAACNLILHVEGAGIKGELARQNKDGYKQVDLA